MEYEKMRLRNEITEVNLNEPGNHLEKKRNFYSHTTFVADLIVVTLWGLFLFRYALQSSLMVSATLWLFCLVRVALSFEMQRRSPWVLFASLTFAIGYLCGIGFEWFLYPARRMVYYTLCFTVNGRETGDLYLDVASGRTVIVQILNGLLLLWLVALPIFTALVQHKAYEIEWERKTFRILTVGCVCICLFLISQDFLEGIMAGCLLLNILPFLYWTIYQRKGRSLVEVLSRDSYICRYTVIVLAMALYILVGMQNNPTIKIWAMGILPVILFIIVCRWNRICLILTGYCVCLAVGGVLYWAVVYAPYGYKILTICVAIILSIYIAVSMFLSTRKLSVGMIVLTLTVIGNPVLLGLNPYVATDVDAIIGKHWGYSPENGSFIIIKDDKIGLRDRFGLILPPEYDFFEKLDPDGRYISVLNSPGTRIIKDRYGVYDTAIREFVIDPTLVTVTEMILMGNRTYKLMNENREQFATLILPGSHPELNEYLKEPRVEPCRIEPSRIDSKPDTESATDIDEDDDDDWDSNGESQNSQNRAAEQLMGGEKNSVMLKYKGIMEKDRDYSLVYTAWVDLMSYMEEQLVDYTYGEPYYSYQPLQFYHDMRLWYENILEFARLENDILSGNFTDTSSSWNNKNQKNIDNEEKIFFNHYDLPGNRDTDLIASKIKPAYYKWIEVRKSYSEELDEEQRLWFNKNTNALRNYLFNEIKGLTENRNDNAE